MKYVFVLAAAGILAGCAPTVALRNPATGETVACGSYTFVGFGEHDTLTPAEQRCVDQYKSQGYTVLPRATGRVGP